MKVMDNEPTTIPQPASPPVAPSLPQRFCPVCHQPVLPTWYFCPNCGTKLSEPPLSTSFWTQVGVYLFSIVLPIMAFIAIKYWPGIKYLKSRDWTRKQIGIIALALIIISTVIVTWWSIVWFEGFMQSSTGGLMGGMNNLGF
jgi:hypothetical protein